MNTKKKKIIDAALMLFIDKGFASTSIQDIINEAGISKGTFYNYFASKNECLMAILDFVQQEGDKKRRELALGKDVDDEEVLIKQIAIRMDMNREHNLIAIFETVTFSNDKDLVDHIRKQHLDEIEWLAKRLEDIYSFHMNKYALDQAAMLFGMIHHIMHVWKLGTDQEIELEAVIKFAFDRLKPVLQDQMEKKETFFPRDWLLSKVETNITDLKEQIFNQIHKLRNSLSESKAMLEYLEFILLEIQSDEPKRYVLDTVLAQLEQSAKESKQEQSIRMLTQDIWNLLDVLK